MNKLTYFIFAMLLATPLQNALAQSVVINEILASNSSVNADEDGSFEDWVELYNPSGNALNLNGFGLSDDPELPLKWIFPNISMPGGSYLLVWCSDKNRAIAGSPLHTNFKISASGEQITLSNPSGTAINSAPAVETDTDISYGRLPNGTGSFTILATPTPGASNGASGPSEIVDPPSISVSGGFYQQNLTVSLSTTTPGASIIYTLDGSEPDPENLSGHTYSYKNKYAELAGQSSGPLLTKSYQTIAYTTPIVISDRSTLPNKIAAISATHQFNPEYLPTQPIFKGTVLKAKAIKPGANPSKTVTRSYFITSEGEDRFSLPVISVSINEDKLFNYQDGIYVAGADFDAWRADNPTVNSTWYNFNANFRRTGDESERPGHVDYFVNGNEILNQDIGIRINGGSSRAWQSKSLRLVARSEYGSDVMQYQFFSQKPTTDFNRLVLRNSGNDFYGTYYRDALVQNLVTGLAVETQAYQPAIAFINGEYWGLLNLREHYDSHYFKNGYDIGEDELDMLENHFSVAEGDEVDFENMQAFLESNSLATQGNYDYIKTRLDVDNFTDYYILNIFLQNTDWPGWNCTLWRKRTATFEPSAPYGQDGRWRAAVNDTDACFGTALDINDHDTLAFATEPNGPAYPNPPDSTLILRSLLQNDVFRIAFISRFADLMNSYFTTDRIVATSNQMKAVIAPEIQEHIDRWNVSSQSNWENEISTIETFAAERPAYQRSHIRNKFNISHDIDVTINVSNPAQGYVKVNTIDILPQTPGISESPYPWSGIYFSNIPVKLKAVANPGYVFSHWSGASASTNAEITITSEASFEATAIFIADTAPAASHPICFWMMDNNIPNNFPLQNLSNTYHVPGVDGTIHFQSCIPGYPLAPNNENWRKASLERRNSPTAINYLPEANHGISFAASDMKGLQVKEPLKNGSLENTLIFEIPTTGYKNIKLSFAVINEETSATGISVEYSVNSGAPNWTSNGITQPVLPLNTTYELNEVDFSQISAVANNPDFKVRLRFTGSGTIDNGNRITFNNIALMGTLPQLSVPDAESVPVIAYPNPFHDVISISGLTEVTGYKIFSMDERVIRSGKISVGEGISLSDLSDGIYLLQIDINGSKKTIKILKS